MSIVDRFQAFNTIYYDPETAELKGKDTDEGEREFQANGKRKVLATKEQLAGALEKMTVELTDNVSSTLFENYQDVQKEFFKFFDMINITPEQRHEIVESVNEKIVKKFTEIIHRRIEENKSTVSKKQVQVESTRISKLSGELSKKLKINSPEEFISPILEEEEAFIQKYLNDSGIYQKRKAHYEMLQRFTDNLQAKQKACLTSIEIKGHVYPVYDLDGSEYQFFGCAGQASSIMDDYVGYQTGKWQHLCISLVDQDHIYYGEDSSVLQILSVDPETILFTYHQDAMTPVSPQEERQEWNYAARRILVITDRITTAQVAFKQLSHIGSTPLRDEDDQFLSMQNQYASVLHLLKFDEKTKAAHSDLIMQCIRVLTNKFIDDDSVRDTLIELKNSGLLHEKDFLEFANFVINWRNIQMLSYNKQGLINILINLEKFFSSTALTPEVQKRMFIHLFKTDDPSGNYNIIQELINLRLQVENIPQLVGYKQGYEGLGIKLNRIKGPGEIIAETEPGNYNEINIDTSIGKGIAVKGWLIPKKYLNTENAELLFKVAAKEGIPIYMRSAPFA